MVLSSFPRSGQFVVSNYESRGGRGKRKSHRTQRKKAGRTQNYSVGIYHKRKNGKQTSQTRRRPLSR